MYSLSFLLLLIVLFGTSGKILALHVVSLINWCSCWGFLQKLTDANTLGKNIFQHFKINSKLLGEK